MAPDTINFTMGVAFIAVWLFIGRVALSRF